VSHSPIFLPIKSLHFTAVVFGVGWESMPFHLRITSLLVATGMLSLPVGLFSPPDHGRLIATAEIINQKYCPVEDELFKVILTLRLKYENRTDKMLILDKQIGKFPDERIIAKSRKSLALRDYEDDPFFDSFGYEDPPHFKPSIDLLRSNFILLTPGQSFDSGTTVEVFVWYESKPPRKGAINYGDHVLQMGFVGWRYAARAFQFAEAWRNLVNSSRRRFTQSPLISRYQRAQELKRCATETARA
jgi:hypothetical protein